MEIGMRVGLGITITLISLSVIVLVAVVGTKESKEFAAVLEKQKPEIQKINELITAALKPDTTITCTKSGGLYKYEINIKDFAVKFKDEKNPHREITIMPVLSYKGKKALDSEKSFAVLKSDEEKTLPTSNPENGLKYTITSAEPPTIFKDDKIYHGYLLKDQRIVINDFDVSIIDQSLIGSTITPLQIIAGTPPSDSRCTITAEVSCFSGIVPERKHVRLTECNDDEKKACEKSVIVCGSSVTIKLLEYRNKESACTNWKPVLFIDTSEKPLPLFAPEKKQIDRRLKERFIVGFCGKVSDSYECTFTPESTEFYGPMFVEVTPDNYLANECIESL